MRRLLMFCGLILSINSYAYYSISPYAWCGNNPVRFVDPNGMDIYDVDSTGTIVRQEENKEKDILWIVDKDGKRIDGKSVEFEYGTIKAQQNDSSTTLSFSNNQSGAKAFRFLADNSMVEYLLVTTLSNYSVHTTQHNEHNVAAKSVIDAIMNRGNIISIMIHNHPNNSNPSGFGEKKGGDKLIAQKIDSYTQMPIEYCVYQPKEQQVVIYDSKKINSSMTMRVYIMSVY